MFKISESTDAEDAQIAAQKSPPFGPGFPADLAARATRLEVWGTTLTDAGDDYTEFRLYSGRVLLEKRRLAGY